MCHLWPTGEQSDTENVADRSTSKRFSALGCTFRLSVSPQEMGASPGNLFQDGTASPKGAAAGEERPEVEGTDALETPPPIGCEQRGGAWLGPRGCAVMVL